MSVWLIGLVTFIYLGVAVSEFLNTKYGMALCFLGFSLANVGLILAMIK